MLHPLANRMLHAPNRKIYENSDYYWKRYKKGALTGKKIKTLDIGDIFSIKGINDDKLIVIAKNRIMYAPNDSTPSVLCYEFILSGFFSIIIPLRQGNLRLPLPIYGTKSWDGVDYFSTKVDCEVSNNGYEYSLNNYYEIYVRTNIGMY